MRYLLVLGFSFLLLGAGCNEPKPKASVKAPPAVEQTLRTLFPQVTKVRWEWDEAGFYEAHFTPADSLHRKLRVSPDGRWRETETDVARTALPVPVQDTLQAELDRTRDPKLFRIRNVSVLAFADGRTEYEAHVRVAGKWYKRYYDAKGRLLRQQQVKHG